MTIVYLGAICVMVLLFIVTLSYRKSERKIIDRNKYKLKILYGMSMFIVDRLPEKIRNKESRVDKLIRQLSVKENITEERYYYLVEKTSLSILIIAVALALGLIVSITENVSNQITELQRSASGEKTYQFIVNNNSGEKDKVVIQVPRKQITTKQAEKILNNSHKELIRSVLGENKNVDYVNKPLNLVNTFGSNNIKVTWLISDDNTIDYQGEIGDNVPTEGKVVMLTATMTLGEINQDFIFSVNVFPKAESDSRQEIIQRYVEENDIYKDKVSLPANLGQEQVNYYQESEAMAGKIGIGGLIIAIAIFFVKDKELKSEMDKRNEQLMEDYSEIVSKILLYSGAGLSIKSTFEKIVNNYQQEKNTNSQLCKYGYEEMELAVNKMRSGVSVITAVGQYGSRCGLHSYIKLAGIIEQNMKRGTKELGYALKTEMNNAVNERKNEALKSGSSLSTKLLGPMIIMLIIAMVIIMVPAFLSINI